MLLMFTYKKQKKATKSPVHERYILAITIILLMGMGIYLMYNVKASSIAVSLEPELGTLASGAVSGSDAAASGGKFIKFSTPASETTSAERWIINNFNGITPISGTKTGRQNIETPAFLKNYNGSGGKYTIAAVDTTTPDDRRIALLNSKFTNPYSTVRYGASLHSSQYTSGINMKWYISKVYVEPNWPKWVDYATTNYDGLTIDGPQGTNTELYAEDLTIKNWNADAAIDTKATKNQFVRLTIEGSGNRSLRLWRPGPTYLVDSRIDNPGGSGNGALVWMKDCSTTIVRVWNSTFNGSTTIPTSKISCEIGNPSITYLTKDPRTTGEMHPMFSTN